MLGADRDQLLNLILSNGLANKSFMAYNFPGFVQVHSTKAINGKKNRRNWIFFAFMDDIG